MANFANENGFNGGIEQACFIRLDSDNIEFVYELNEGIAFDGAFASTGDFYYTPIMATFTESLILMGSQVIQIEATPTCLPTRAYR